MPAASQSPAAVRLSWAGGSARMMMGWVMASNGWMEPGPADCRLETGGGAQSRWGGPRGGE
jgi:hypothetical protein